MTRARDFGWPARQPHLRRKVSDSANFIYRFRAERVDNLHPVPQFTEEDLGLALKVTPKVNGDGDVALDVEAEYKSLRTIYFGIRSLVIAQRKYAGTVVLREGEWR